MIKRNAPCKDCENRFIGCHSNCEAYKEFRNNIDKKNAKLREDVISRRIDFEGRKRRMRKLKEEK